MNSFITIRVNNALDPDRKTPAPSTIFLEPFSGVVCFNAHDVVQLALSDLGNVTRVVVMLRHNPENLNVYFTDQPVIELMAQLHSRK